MGYATPDDATTLYGQDFILASVDRDKDGQPDLPAFQDSLDDAASEIDSYIGFRYPVPVSPVPKILKRFTIDIAVYHSSPGLNRTDEKRKRYEDAVQWLVRASRGEVAVVIEGPADVEPRNENLVQLTSGARIMTREKMQGVL